MAGDFLQLLLQDRNEQIRQLEDALDAMAHGREPKCLPYCEPGTKCVICRAWAASKAVHQAPLGAYMESVMEEVEGELWRRRNKGGQQAGMGHGWHNTSISKLIELSRDIRRLLGLPKRGNDE